MVMKMDIDEVAFKKTLKVIRELPAKYQKEAYVAGFMQAGRYIRRKARLYAPLGKGPWLTNKGFYRRPMRENFWVKRMKWTWDGVTIPKSAAMIVNYSPHYPLVEKGTRKMRKQPMMLRALKSHGPIMANYRKGTTRAISRINKKVAVRPSNRR